jgi:aminopeptidase N
VLIGASLYDNPQDPAFIVTITHEAAHQWWYNLVGNDVFLEPWLDEGLTTYTSAVFLQDTYGQDAYAGLVEYWSQRYARLVQDGYDEQVARPLEYFEQLGNPSVYGGVVYTKCALFFKALREEVGDKVFFGVLRQYFSENKYQIATGEDLLDLFERQAGRDLDALYQEWLYTP